MKITVIVHPNAKTPRIEVDLLQTIHVFVNKPPIEGQANRATTLALADYFHIKTSSVKLISGAKSKYKVFEINKTA